MPLVIGKPEIRFQRKYKDRWTVLEGSELGALLKHFFHHMRHRTKKGDDVEKAMILSIAHAFHSLYGRDIVTEDELKHLSTPDARKMDLFFRGITQLLAKASTPTPQNPQPKRTPRKPSKVLRFPHKPSHDN